MKLSRPKSANRTDDSMGSGKPTNPTRSARPERERLLPALKRPSVIPRRVTNENTLHQNKTGRAIITVPLAQKPLAKLNVRNNNTSGLPDQETIKKHEEMEVKQGVMSDAAQILHDFNEKESITSKGDKVLQLRINWQEKLVQFEKIKTELHERQGTLMELYATMRSTHEKMVALGQKVNLPPAEDLKIMNVAKMSPEQLLQLCAGARKPDDKTHRDDYQSSTKYPLSIDVNKLYNIPYNIIATCEQTLAKRKEIIVWLDALAKDKGITVDLLLRKIKEFYAENEMLHCALGKVKGEFLKELNDVVDFLRKSMKDTMDLQLRTEELNYETSELNAQNTDLRKQIHNTDHVKSQINRNRLEDLEKELKEEKCKKMVIRDRLSRAEGQVKIGVEQVAQLEAVLEQSRSHAWALERTVQQLTEQNQKLQMDFDKDLNKLTDSIRENTAHLEEIADAREKLQTEKEDLEKRLSELSDHYNVSLKNIKHEMNGNIAKLIETEKKYNEKAEECKKLQTNTESLCTQLLESELRYKDVIKQLKEKESQLSEALSYQQELEKTERNLRDAKKELDDYKSKLIQQSEIIKEIETKFKETRDLEENLKRDLTNKNEYITELEKKQSLLEQQLQESESKMESYEEQLSSLKNHISQLQEDFGEFENLSEIHEMVNQQRSKLLEATRQNGDLAEALQKKDMELEHHLENFADQEHLLKQKDGIIKMLSEKEEEQANIIKLLRNNLEMRAQADTDLNQQLAEKNTEIDSLISNVETRKQEITQLEKIILTLEDQTRKGSLQKRKDQEKIFLLEKKITEYEAYHTKNKRSIDIPVDNLDNLIKILEDELGTPIDPQLNTKDREYVTSRKKYIGDRNIQEKHKFEGHEINNNSLIYSSETETVPTKIIKRNFVKKTYVPTNEEYFKSDNLDRKKAITNIETQKWHLPTEVDNINMYVNPPPINDSNFPPYSGIIPPGHAKERNLVKNSFFPMPNHLRDEKKCKMFKFAGHRLQNY